MSRLRIFADNTPDTPEFSSSDGDAIARELDKIGVTFERWQAAQPIAPGASPEEVMEAYRADIDRLVAKRGFKSVDVVSIAPDNPKREEMRAKFLDEHFHKEDEVRFRSEEHTSELQSLMRISYAVFCLTQTKKKNHTSHT